VSTVNSVYLVWCAPDGDDETARLIGAYSTEPLAVARVERAKTIPGLDHEECDFRITRCTLDEYEWAVSK
jgi:hypothetical protein